MAKGWGAEFSMLASEGKVAVLIEFLVGVDVLRIFCPGEALIVLILKVAAELVAEKVESGNDRAAFVAEFVERV